MITTSKLLAAIKKSHSNCSDYQVAKLLNVTRGTVSCWARKKTYMSEQVARKAAQLLALDEDYVVACVHAEQHKEDDLYPIWERICGKLEERSRAA